MPTTYSGTGTLRTTDASTADADAIDAALAASGDAHAFERLYRRHVNRVHNLVRRMLGEDAEEVTQEVLVRAWQKLGTFRGEAAFGTWRLKELSILILSVLVPLWQISCSYP